MSKIQYQPKLFQIEQILSKNSYFSKDVLPGFADGVIFKLLLQNEKYPDKKNYPNFYHWYVIMKQFSLKSIEQWIRQKKYQQNQSQKSLMIFSQIFLKDTNYLNKLINKKPTISIPSKIDKNSHLSETLVNVDLNSPQYFHKKAEYVMKIEVRIVEKVEQIIQKFNNLKQKDNKIFKNLKIKELNINKKQKVMNIRFQIQRNKIDLLKNQILKWSEVRNVYFQSVKTSLQKQNIMRTLSFR